MSTLRRELLWAGTVLIQIPLLVSFTALGSFLLHYAWLEGLFRIPHETVLLPAWIGIISTGPLIIAMLMLWAWQFMRRRRGKPPRAGAILHLTAAFAGALALFEWLAWAEEGGPVVSGVLLIPSVPVALVAFCLLYWPRIAFRSLRAG
jgi:hypothetical protein